MNRVLVAVLLLHHIEGVCKPWSAATLAAREVLDSVRRHIRDRDTQAAVLRAQEAAQRRLDRVRVPSYRGRRNLVIRGHVRHEVEASGFDSSTLDQLRQAQKHEQERDR